MQHFQLLRSGLDGAIGLGNFAVFLCLAVAALKIGLGIAEAIHNAKQRKP